MEDVGASEFSLRFAIAWMLGFMPALIVRFAWMKKPLNRPTAFWAAGAFSLAFFGISRILVEPTDPAIMRSGLMWAFLFIISFSIMAGGRRQNSAPSN